MQKADKDQKKVVQGNTHILPGIPRGYWVSDDSTFGVTPKVTPASDFVFLALL